MSLQTQVFLYSIGTDAFYDANEQYVHQRLLMLYKLRQKVKDKQDKKLKWYLTCINKVIQKEKKKLTAMLNNSVQEQAVRTLNPNCLKDKNIINLFESDLTRNLELKPFELTTDLMIVNVFFFQVFENIVKQGFIYNGDKYVFLTASAGQIRTKRALFIREKSYNRVKMRLMCGLTEEKINQAGGMNPNKFCAYLALMNSATDEWTDFDIDRSIVVEDFETMVDGEVDYIDSSSYQIIRKQTQTPIPHMDGCGIMLTDKTRMVRLPWIKGLLVNFPFDRFLRQKCKKDEWIISDIYGTPHNVVLEDIKYIFTKSQFKLWKYYNSWEEYKNYFKAYGCKACYCNIEEDFIPKAKINYQMLQTLSDMTDEEIKHITEKTNEEIDSVGKDFQTTMRLLGATSYNQNKSYMQEALMIYPELFRDNYNKEILKNTFKSLVKQAKAGKLRVNGKYLFISPDLYAFCEWLFQGKMNPEGLLKDGEIYTREFRNGDELACLRSPHLYREWAIRNNNRSEELDKWFGSTKCVYTSCHDLISRILQFDCDGDKALVIKDKTLTTCAKRNMKDIVPLAYELKKAKGGLLNNDSLYEGMKNAYTGGNIGPISNNITKVWNSGKIQEEQINVVKWLCMENNQVIDFAKTLWRSEPPDDIKKTIKSYTKSLVPYFFMYAKDKQEYQVEPCNNSTMNRISSSFNKNRIMYSKNIWKFDWRILLNQECGYTVVDKSPIIEKYKYCLSHQYEFNLDNDNIKDDDMWQFRKIRQVILDAAVDKDIEYVVNTLVAYAYTVTKSSNKKMLWASFGDVIVKNIKNNTVGLGNICPVCGKRFHPTRGKQDIYCSIECRKTANKDMKQQWYESPKIKKFEQVENAESIENTEFFEDCDM